MVGGMIADEQQISAFGAWNQFDGLVHGGQTYNPRANSQKSGAMAPLTDAGPARKKAIVASTPPIRGQKRQPFPAP
jgi:hypothetical protein